MNFSWEPYPGIIEYRVQMKDSSGKTVLDKKTKTSKIEFSLPPGVYKIKIDSTTKFNKPGPATDWEQFEIIKKITKPKRIEDYRYNLKFGLGGLYSMVQPAYRNYINDTYAALNFHAALLFSYGLLRFAGLELENTYQYYEGKSNLENDGITARVNLTGMNVFFRTNFMFPLNIIARAGGGVSYTSYQYTLDSQTAGGEPVEYSISSTDYYLRFGLSFELTLFSTVYIEPGADYVLVYYKNNTMKTYQFFCRVGMLYNFADDTKKTGKPGTKSSSSLTFDHYITLQSGFVPLHSVSYTSGGGLTYYGFPFKLSYTLFLSGFGIGLSVEYLMLSDNIFTYSFIIPGADFKYNIKWGLYAGFGASYKYSLGMGIVDQSVQQSSEEALNFKRRNDWWGSVFVGYNLFLGSFYINAEARGGYNFTKGMFATYELNNTENSKAVEYTFEVSLYLGAGIKL